MARGRNESADSKLIQTRRLLLLALRRRSKHFNRVKSASLLFIVLQIQWCVANQH
jgi:hypothetical protein